MVNIIVILEVVVWEDYFFSKLSEEMFFNTRSPVFKKDPKTSSKAYFCQCHHPGPFFKKIVEVTTLQFLAKVDEFEF
jgi:hypothetical protein